MTKKNLSEKIIWTTERRKLGDLIPWSRNPRQIKREQARRLQESHAEFGQVETFAIGPGNEVYNGHQRLAAWAEEYGPDLEVDVRVSSRPLTEKEREKLTVYLHKGAVGEWNFDVLSEWDVPDLLEWGFSELELGIDNEQIESFDEKTEPEEIPEQYMILIECETEQEQAELLERFNEEGLKCRALLS